MSEKYLGNYLGIVIQNNDPKSRGRVKIFVPHISPTVYKNWNEVPEDKKFKFLGANLDSSLNDIYEDLKLILPLIGQNLKPLFSDFSEIFNSIILSGRLNKDGNILIASK